jgi:hypothetical protein
MKKIILLTVLSFVSLNISAQKKEKVKGSKVVVIQQKKVEPFTAIEVLDDIEISLIKADKSGVELEADDNLQDILDLKMNGSVLIISFAKEISSAKKFNIRVNYAADLVSVVAKNKSKVSALETIKLENVSFKGLDNSKLFLNIDVKNCTLTLTDKSTAEVNDKSETFNVDLSKNAELKALISATNFKCDLYQGAEANLDGDVINMKSRIDNDSKLNAKKLNAKSIDLTVEASAKAIVNAEKTIVINANSKAEIELFGDAKIDLQQFKGTSTLSKKQLK